MLDFPDTTKKESEKIPDTLNANKHEEVNKRPDTVLLYS